MKKIVFLILFLMLLIILFFSIKPRHTFFPRESELKVVDEKKIDREIEKLSSKLSSFTDTNKEYVNTMVELGIYYFIKGHQFYDKSINLLYEAWKLGSSDIRIFYYLGCMYEFLNLNTLAIEEYKKFLTNVPDDEEVLVRMGNLYYKLNDLENAVKYYLKVLNKNKDNVIALSNLGFIYFTQKQVDKAQECFLKVLEISKKKNIIEPKNVNYYLGQIFFNNSNYETAIKYLNREQEKYPDNINNSLLLVKSYYNIRDYKNAYTLTEQLLEVIPDNKELKKLKRELEHKI